MVALLNPEPVPADVRNVRTDAAFRTWMVGQGYSPRTVALYGLYVRQASEWLSARGSSLAQANEHDLNEWWSTLPLSASSRNGARHALRAWYRHRGKRDGGPAAGIERIPAPLSLPRPLPADEFDLLTRAAQALGGVHELFITLLASTGCRIGEAQRARWHQFELGDQPVWYIEGKGARRRGPKVRQVPVNDSLSVVLARWRTESRSPDWLFPSERSARGYQHQSTLRRRLTEVCEAAGVDRATAHRWRHTVATVGLERTGDLRGVQELLGHASLATTQVYTKVQPGRLRGIVDCL